MPLNGLSHLTIASLIFILAQGSQLSALKLSPKISNIILNGDWVIGRSHYKNSDENDLNKLVYSYYLSAYVNQWDGVLLSLNLKNINSEKQLDAILQKL